MLILFQSEDVLPVPDGCFEDIPNRSSLFFADQPVEIISLKMKPFHQFMGCDGLIVGLDIAAYFFKDSPVYIFCRSLVREKS